jgi:cephalosporin-C deacetylase-like acetyl esterase
MDAVRAVNILASIDGVIKDRIRVVGESQGGGLSLATAALSQIPFFQWPNFFSGPFQYSNRNLS